MRFPSSFPLVALTALLTVQSSTVGAQVPADLIGKTIVAHQISSYSLFADSVVTEAPFYEITFEVRRSGVVQRTVKDLRSGQVETDDTEYRWLFTDNPLAFMPDALRFQPLPRGQLPAPYPTVVALGRAGGGSEEILTIGPGWVQSVATLGAVVNVSYYLRTQ